MAFTSVRRPGVSIAFLAKADRKLTAAISKAFLTSLTTEV